MRAGYRAIEMPKPHYVYSLADEGMLLNRARPVAWPPWRIIRRKHAELYRPQSLLHSAGNP